MTAKAGRAAWLVVLGGVAAALHVGKLPPALPVLRDALGLTLVEAGFLLSLVQFAGMTLGLVVGLAADGLGLKRTMVAGLAITGVSSLAGGFATQADVLLVLRALEGLGFLLASMPAPGLIRRNVAPAQMSTMLAVWSTYMPFATAAALLAGPACMVLTGWQGWWWLLGVLSLVMAVVLLRTLQPDPRRPDVASGMGGRVRLTLGAKGPWLIALAFGVYSAQWLAVIGFLPSIYLAAGLEPGWAAAATALAAAVNMVGNLLSGRFLQHGVAAPRLLVIGYVTMGLGGLLAFADLLPRDGAGAVLRFAAVLAFSGVGGMIPGTLFSLAVQLAPSESTVSSTVGWMQQWSAFGQFTGPPLVAWVAARVGGWQWSWIVTSSCAFAGVGLALWIARVGPARTH